MALFGGRALSRMNSVMSSSSGHGEPSAEDGGDSNDGKCTAEKVKSCMKMFFAQLFSHVGLCALVIGYSIMGAFIFVHLEKDNELETRVKVGDARKVTLDQLYNITAHLRLELILQEEEIQHLSSEVHRLQSQYASCDRRLVHHKSFLSELITRYKGDNVPLTNSSCQSLCEAERLKKKTCEELCNRAHSCAIVKKVLLSDSENKTAPIESRTKRSTQTEETVFLGSEEENTIIRQETDHQDCHSFHCVVEDGSLKTLCLTFRDPDFHDNARRLQENSQDDKHFNVLWRENWTREAGKVLKQFEQDVIRKAKTEGYDGHDEEDTATLQWNFSGALLYSVTVITTIGYGNIAPKTNWGRIVTMIYAIFGMPLFLMWASQMGTFLAHSFQFLYSNICCVLCIRGQKRRAALAKAARSPKLLDASSQISLDQQPVRVGIIKPTESPDNEREPSVYDNVLEDEEDPMDEPSKLHSVVSISAGTPVTSLLNNNNHSSPQFLYASNHNSRKPSGNNDEEASKSASFPQEEAASSGPSRVPVLPVLAFVGGYITLGATIFSTWEKWTLLEGAYFSFITLTTIGFGDFVPGDAVLNDDSEHGQAKLILACIYVLMGLAVISMAINLVQEEIMERFRQLAIDMGIIENPLEEEVTSSR